MKPFISFCLLLCICLGKLYAQGVNIVYIGNSITQGALLKTPVTEAPPVQASQYIEQATKQSVAFRNCGVSGTTTLDFLPIPKRLDWGLPVNSSLPVYGSWECSFSVA